MYSVVLLMSLLKFNRLVGNMLVTITYTNNLFDVLFLLSPPHKRGYKAYRNIKNIISRTGLFYVFQAKFICCQLDGPINKLATHYNYYRFS